MVYVSLCGHVCASMCMFGCVCQAYELLQAERGRVERLAQIVCEQRSRLDSCPEATKEPLQEQLARVSTHLHFTHTCTGRYVLEFLNPWIHANKMHRQAYNTQLNWEIQQLCLHKLIRKADIMYVHVYLLTLKNTIYMDRCSHEQIHT